MRTVLAHPLPPRGGLCAAALLGALIVAPSCGNKKPAAGRDGAIGGDGGFDNAAGTGGGGPSGGGAGTTDAQAGGQSGVGGSPAVGGGAPGGASVLGGAPGGGGSSGGSGGGGAVGGTGGGCDPSVVCEIGAQRCNVGAYEECAFTAQGCLAWGPGMCCPGLECQAASGGFCDCSPNAGCGNTAGSICMSPGSTTVWECTVVAPGCFEIVGGFPCATGRTCDATGVVPTGTACGCPPPGNSPATSCATLGDTITLPCDAVLRCEASGVCQVWRFH
jgi:hypothetical protein